MQAHTGYKWNHLTLYLNCPAVTSVTCRALPLLLPGPLANSCPPASGYCSPPLSFTPRDFVHLAPSTQYSLFPTNSILHRATWQRAGVWRLVQGPWTCLSTPPPPPAFLLCPAHPQMTRSRHFLPHLFASASTSLFRPESLQSRAQVSLALGSLASPFEMKPREKETKANPLLKPWKQHCWSPKYRCSCFTESKQTCHRILSRERVPFKLCTAPRLWLVYNLNSNGYSGQNSIK